MVVSLAARGCETVPRRILTPGRMNDRLDFIQRANASYLEEMYARFRSDPASVPEEWALFFAGFDFGADRSGLSADGRPSGGVFGLVHAYREFGHRIARLDPLSEPSEDHPLLDPALFGFSEQDLDRPVDPRPFLGLTRGTLRELIAA